MTADAGAPWRLLLADKHYSTCATPRRGKHVDAVAVWPQAGNNIIRLIEIKQQEETTSNLQQKFETTGQAVLKALRGAETPQLTAELHIKAPPPRSSRPFNYAPKIAGKKYPVSLHVNGEPV